MLHIAGGIVIGGLILWMLPYLIMVAASVFNYILSLVFARTFARIWTTLIFIAIATFWWFHGAHPGHVDEPYLMVTGYTIAFTGIIALMVWKKRPGFSPLISAAEKRFADQQASHEQAIARRAEKRRARLRFKAPITVDEVNTLLQCHPPSQ